MTAVDVFLLVVFVLWFIDRVMDLVLHKMTDRQVHMLCERMDMLEKRFELLLQASELQYTMIASNRDDLDRVIKAINANNN